MKTNSEGVLSMLVERTSNQDNFKNGCPTIAVLVGAMSSHYQEGIMRGAADVAAMKGYNVIGFCGGVINSPDPNSLARGKIFDLIDMSIISGVISPFSSHMRYLDPQERDDFIDRFSTVPLVNIGSRIQGCTNVITDFESSFVELFEHLYHTHGYRNILLMRGPKTHISSDLRTNTFKKQLAKYNIPFDESMLIYTDLNQLAAEVKFEALLDNRDRPIDAIITVNDNQALGILGICRERGIRVPDDIAVIGSMNTLEGMFSSPTLTSIKEPLYELGQAAAIELIAQIEGKPYESEIQVPTSLVIRHSCGCKTAEDHYVFDSEINNAKAANTVNHCNDDPIFDEMERHIHKIAEQYKGGIARDEVCVLLHAYQTALYKKDCSDFLNLLKGKMESLLKSEDMIIWLAFTTKIQLSTLKYLEQSKDSEFIFNLINKLLVLKSSAEQILFRYQSYETDYYLNNFRVIINDLNSSFDITRIKKYAVDILKLSELHISLFDDINAEVLTSKNLVSVRNNTFIGLENRSFIAKQLLPNGLEPYKERFSLLVLPLSFRDKAIGFMTLNLSDRKGAAFENLRSIISSALKNELLIQDLKKAEKRFSDIAHSTSNWLWETDVDHNFTYSSESVTDIIGYASTQLIGQKITSFNIENGASYLNNMIDKDVLTDYECWCRHRNGNVICLLISATPIFTDGEFNGYRGVFEDITEKKLQEEKIKSLAYSDILTGLPNRTLFQKKLESAITYCSENNKMFALMFIDLDHFKHINDSMGHSAGDLLLVELSKRLSHSIRPRDILARLGGDEFTIILPDISNQKDIIDVAERIFNNIQSPIIIAGKPVYCTLSLGISLYPNDGHDTQTLLQRGDSAMYLAKSQGRNGYVFYDKHLEHKHALRNRYEELLREAIKTGSFLLSYQPQVSSITGDVVGFEALVRINHYQQGIVEPKDFIPLAEELGLIGLIDEWVFEAVCAQHRAWCDQGLKPVRVSVNLSAMQLRSDSLLENYLAILERYQVEPADLQLEITESALIDNELMALRLLQEFKRYGVSIALDDFGTGSSSLSCISLYPIDTIKIDRSFIIGSVDNPKNKAIIEAIVLIATKLSLTVVAEGVETAEQHQFIQQLGCHNIQGTYFYNPASANEVQVLLNQATCFPSHQ
jgi:diguanylate cyclase (GGDEF)-like protein/PAS domain S-box-containing protein